ncbi:hypothetical protein HOB94_06315 [bacterium]|jgi:dihydroneopterin aldolase|nr:hypothetical protein [bacterium]MBT5492526.1 hypothetical protein [bacterium]
MVINTTLRLIGRHEAIYVKNIINMVMLNQETAIKCVSQELLKSCFKSFGRLSLAQIKIHHKNIASSFG